MEEDQQPLQIVILGASFAGLSTVHNIISHVYPEIHASKKFTYKIILVSPSNHLYWNISAPRALVSTQLIPHSDSFRPLADGIGKYPPNKLQWIQGAATSVDTRNRTVQISCPPAEENRQSFAGGYEELANRASTAVNAATRVAKDLGAQGSNPHYDARKGGYFGDESREIVLNYHALIFATGTTAHSPLLSLRGPHSNTVTAIDTFHQQLPTADTVIISGGGPSGVETAGQIAYWYSLQHGPSKPRMPFPNPLSWLASRSGVPSPYTKKVILLSGSSRLLPNLEEPVGAKAYKQLSNLGIRVILGIRVTGASVEGRTGKTTVRLSNGTQMPCDLYVPCTGVTPNTKYLPQDSPLLRGGYIATTPNPSTLRVEIPPELMPDTSDFNPNSTRKVKTTEEEDDSESPVSPDTPQAFGDNPGSISQAARVYAIGDCAAYGRQEILDIYAAIPILIHNLTNDLLAYQLAYDNPYGGNAGEIAELQRQDAVYIRTGKPSQVCPIGYRKPGGVGTVFGVGLPSLVVFLMKGKDYRVKQLREVVEQGLSPYPDSRK